MIGRESPKGWDGIVDQLLLEFEKLPGWSHEYIDQIKEKFAGLRVYISPPVELSEQAELLIRKAEAEAWLTCQGCGTKDDVAKRGNGWVFTECSACHAERRRGLPRGRPR